MILITILINIWINMLSIMDDCTASQYLRWFTTLLPLLPTRRPATLVSDGELVICCRRDGALFLGRPSPDAEPELGLAAGDNLPCRDLEAWCVLEEVDFTLLFVDSFSACKVVILKYLAVENLQITIQFINNLPLLTNNRGCSHLF